MLVFLDFDGVLHPYPCSDSEYFCWMDNLESVLHTFPNTEVIISSSWREHYEFSALQQLFPNSFKSKSLVLLLSLLKAVTTKVAVNWKLFCGFNNKSENMKIGLQLTTIFPCLINMCTKSLNVIRWRAWMMKSLKSCGLF